MHLVGTESMANGCITVRHITPSDLQTQIRVISGLREFSRENVMPLLSRLQPDSATSVGILTAIGVFLIYSNSLPNMADIRLAPPNNNDVDSARKGAAWKSAALITLVFLVSRDINSYIISGGALFGLDYMYKHHNAIQPADGKLEGGASPTISSASAYSLPEDSS